MNIGIIRWDKTHQDLFFYRTTWRRFACTLVDLECTACREMAAGAMDYQRRATPREERMIDAIAAVTAMAEDELLGNYPQS